MPTNSRIKYIDWFEGNSVLIQVKVKAMCQSNWDHMLFICGMVF